MVIVHVVCDFSLSVQGVCVKAEADTIRRILEFFRTVGNFGKLFESAVVFAGSLYLLGISELLLKSCKIKMSCFLRKCRM